MTTSGAARRLLEPPLLLHFRVREYLLGRISAGELAPGQQVPTEMDLMQRFGVSRITVRKALQDLASAGIVYRRAGLGTFVAEPRIEQELHRLTGFVEDMQALGFRASARVVAIEAVPADERVARHLRLAPGAEVTHVQRVRLANEQPLSFDDTYLPAQIGRQIAQENLVVDPIFTLLEQKHGIRLGEAEYVIEAASADRTTARHLGVRVGAPVFLIERTTYAVDGRPVDYERLFYHGERVRYRMRLKR